MMGFRKSELLVFFMVLVSFAIGAYAYDSLPGKVASHWNAQGEVDGHMPKPWGVYFLPAMLAVLAVVFFAIPRIDPYGKNIEQFREYYDNFIMLLMLFMIAVYVQTLLWNMGAQISFNLTMPLGIGALIYYAGEMCGHSKRNWFIGIRTPWTLMSERVWEKTNRMGGKLFKLVGIAAVLSVLLGEVALLAVVGMAIAGAAYVFAYSYFEYQKEWKKEKGERKGRRKA